jgi:hypothetical protein
MMVVHEFGHVLGAWLTGGTVAKVVAHPLTISRTELSDNPHPLFVAWAGPAGGVLLPLAALALAHFCRMPGTYLLLFFTGFCLIANGAYIGVGACEGVGDAGDLLRHGAVRWQLWGFGVVTAPLGLWLWHKQGLHFGLGRAKGEVHPVATYVCLSMLIVLVLAELVLGRQ